MSEILNPSIASERSQAGASAAELGGAFAGLACVVGVLLFASGTTSLITHPLWLDECLTSLLVNDPSFSHAMKALARGVNHSPPALYMMLWPLRWIFGRIGPTELRAFTGVMMLLSAVGLYSICRAFWGRVPSLIGALALLMHPVAVEQIFEARFYVTWLVGTTWFCAGLLHDSRRRSNLWISIASIGSVIACTSHWFAPLGILLVGVTDLIVHRRLSRAQRFRRAIPMLCGFVATAACLPIVLQQRKLAVVPTWLEPISFTEIRIVNNSLFCVLSVSVVVLSWGVWRFIESRNTRTESFNPIDQRALIPINSLLLLPFMLVTISLVLQPVLWARYAIALLVSLGVMSAGLAAMMQTRAGRLLRIIVIVLLLAVGLLQFKGRLVYASFIDRRTASCIDDVGNITARGGPFPLVFLRRHEMYPVIEQRPDLAPSIAFLEFDPSYENGLSTSGRFEEQMAAVDHSMYPQYQLINYAQVRAMRRFFAVVPPESGANLEQLFPNATFQRITPDMYQITFVR